MSVDASSVVKALGVSLDGRRIIVTGAGSGIGHASAELLVALGAHVVLADISPEVMTVAEEISSMHVGAALGVQTDVADELSVRSLVKSAVEWTGGVDGVVNVAGIQRSGSVTQLAVSDWDAQMTVNVRSCFLTSKHAIPAMRDAGGGSIVTTSSGAAIKGAPGMTGYAASKGAILSFTKSLAVEVADDGIRCNSISPGWVDGAGVFRSPSSSG